MAGVNGRRAGSVVGPQGVPGQQGPPGPPGSAGGITSGDVSVISGVSSVDAIQTIQVVGPLATTADYVLKMSGGKIVSGPAPGGGGSGGFFGPWFTAVAPPVVASWTKQNFTAQGFQASAPTATDVASAVSLYLPGGMNPAGIQGLELPASAAVLTLTAGFIPNLTDGYSELGIIVRESGSGAIRFFGLQNRLDFLHLIIQTYSAFGSFSSESVAPNANGLAGCPLLLRAKQTYNSGPGNYSLTFSYSTDGVNYFQSGTVYTYTTPFDRLGFFGGSYNNGGNGAAVSGMLFHWSVSYP